MKTSSAVRRISGLSLHLTVGFWLTLAGWARPAIQSVEVQPVPLQAGSPFTVSVAATDVAQAIAVVDFRPWSTRLLRVTLSLEGNRWTGSGILPEDLVPPAGAEAAVRVLVFDAARARAVNKVRIPASAGAGISANFDPAGILTVTGDAQNNFILVGRTVSGTLQVNNGAVVISGGVPTTANTALISVLGGAGNDVITLDQANGQMPPGNLQGEGGNDTLTGTAAPDEINGGQGSDTLIGRGGNDRLFGGDDGDTFIWNPGDGIDLIEGQAGADSLIFNGSNVAEQIDLSANAARLRFFRNIGNVVMDASGVETVQFNAAGGADAITIGDLSGTGVAAVRLDLAGSPGSGVGDGEAESVVVNGTQGDDVIAIADSGAEVVLTRIPFSVTLMAAEGAIEGALDVLTVNALGGNDVVDATGLPAGRLGLTLNGGLGADVLLGSEGDDLFVGGDGDDVFLAGAGDDTMVWNPGDDNDTLEGQAGRDTMLFNGANVGEVIDVSANGGRVLFFRNIATVVMDLNDVEVVQFNARDGADAITVHDLSGTDLVEIHLDLANPPGSGTGDGDADSIVVIGTNGDDAVPVVSSPDEVVVLGLSVQVLLAGSENANDRLSINLLAGDDVLEASGLAAGFISLTGDGGADHDILIGSDGPDVLVGGPEDDVLIGGGSTDVLDGGPGENVVIQ